jgi:hypothetical protein
MATVDLPISRGVALELRLAQLELENAQLKARLLEQEAAALRAQAQWQHERLVAAFLATQDATLPRPEGPLTLDLDACCIRYEASDTAIPSISSIPVDSAPPSGVD